MGHHPILGWLQFFQITQFIKIDRCSFLVTVYRLEIPIVRVKLVILPGLKLINLLRVLVHQVDGGCFHPADRHEGPKF